MNNVCCVQLVAEDGDFLVRESTACAGQFVLTGARRGHHKHLLLVDPNGVVSLTYTFTNLPGTVNKAICGHKPYSLTKKKPLRQTHT
jgi:hypothetical protein